MNFPVAIDMTEFAHEKILAATGTPTIPRLITIDRHGMIRFVDVPNDALFDSHIEHLLNEMAEHQEKESIQLLPIVKSRNELAQMHVSDLKAILDERHISYVDCFEKTELVNRIIELCSIPQTA